VQTHHKNAEEGHKQDAANQQSEQPAAGDFTASGEMEILPHNTQGFDIARPNLKFFPF
jgi:hypothetical protein